MIIFIEGPDGSGKSTLAKQLSKDMGWPTKAFSWPKTDDEKQKMFLEYKRFIMANHNVIVDRGWWSEMIYGPIMRDKSYITEEQRLELEALAMSTQGAMVIHCNAPTQDLYARLVERGDDYIEVSKSNVRRIKMAYDDMFREKSHNLMVVHYEYNENVRQV